MNGEKIISRKDFGKIFLGIGILFVALGIVFNLILDPEVIYDLPIYVGGVGIALLIYGGKQFFDKKNADMDVVFSSKTVKNFLTDNAIIIALLLLVIVIMIIQPRFMQYTCISRYFNTIINKNDCCSWNLFYIINCRY